MAVCNNAAAAGAFERQWSIDVYHHHHHHHHYC
jgi:hypothetical protein